ncbi:hypothetical protein F5Y17DRAFT_475820 [Xylariaceae sp. FL0594]|nr:hypothetical protein F5Y17DRAFT_475820 [Xylariaceae sp. FL0594]
MEALAAIGLASNIFQFVEVGYKIVITAKELRSSGKETIQFNHGLEFITREMKELSERVQQESGLNGLTEDESALLRLSSECQKCSGELLDLLAKLKTKHGWELQLDSLRKQMDLQIGKLASASAEASQNEIAATKEIIKSIQKAIQGSKGVTRFSESHHYLRLILQTSNDSLVLSRRSAILDALAHRDMKQRFANVKQAHSATFGWLLRDPRQDQEEEVSNQDDEHREQANLDFTNWLRSRTGIFHIAGKPGAEEWCGHNKRVFPNCFLWRQGKEDQKNLTGLMRCLLYQVLESCPELIQLAFSDRWARISESGIRNHMDDGEIKDAFYRLFDARETFRGRKFAFIIDALDEYNGRHIELVHEIVRWSSQHMSDLKICVSSREYNEFTVGFSKCPSFRIHEWTRNDISLFVNDKIRTLQDHVAESDKSVMESLGDAIVSNAQGVFVWVSLVLVAVEDGVLNGEDISGLEARIRTFPTELNDLYQYLLDSISESDRSNAFEWLMLTRFLDPSLRHLYTPIARYYLLNKIIADPDFALKMPINEGPVEAEKCHQAKRQLYGRCKGLLEISRGRGENSEVVWFMHSTALEYLDKPHVKQIIEDKVGHVDVLHRACMSFLALLKYTCPHLGSKQNGGTDFDIYSWFSDFLNAVQTVCAKRFSAKDQFRADWMLFGPYFSSSAQLKVTHDMLLIIKKLQAGLFEFVTQKDLERLGAELREGRLHPAWVLPLHPLHFSKYQYCGSLDKTIQLLLAAGVSPNTSIDASRHTTIFEYCIRGIIRPPGFPNRGSARSIMNSPLTALERCLRHGARSEICLVFGPTFQRRGTDTRLIRVSGFRGYGDCLDITHDVPCTETVVSLALQKGGILTLKHLFEFWFPDDYERLNQLLDRNAVITEDSLPPLAFSDLELRLYALVEDYMEGIPKEFRVVEVAANGPR